MLIKPPRLLYLPNEPVLGWQTGPRRYFDEAAARGQLGGYETVSFEFEAARIRDDEAVCRQIYQTAETFQPDILLWQHIANFRISREFLRRLKNLPSRPTLVYHEADMYGSLREIKTPSKSMKLLAAEADLTFVVGLGKSHLIQGDGFAGRQETHDHVFQSTLGGDGGHTEFDVLAAVFFELDLAILG